MEEVNQLIERARLLRKEAVDSIGSKAIRLHNEAKQLEVEATMKRWLCSK